jgi:transcription antitermination factor NusG
MFLWGTMDQAYEADRTRKVASLIPVTDQDHLEWELGNIDRALAGDAKLEPHPPIAEGVRVRVRAGPFRDLEGVVKRYSKEDLLVLQVAMLGNAASLEIERSLLVPLD